MLPDRVIKYLRSRGITGPWRITGPDWGNFIGAVVIPSLAESDSLFATLLSLAQNPPDLLSRFLVLVVVNHRADSPREDKDDNILTLRRLSENAVSLAPMRLAWVDAASAGRELPAKGGGVGLARKIGFDLALSLLAFERSDPLLIALDADTLVRPDYLPSLVSHFQMAAAGGAVIPFCHQGGSSPRHDRAIRRYELFLRSYVLGLSRADSPYAFHTVGSAMACTAGAYVMAGGMNSRVAGEDFYFLQQLHRTSGVAPVEGTVVYPSARASRRVPFGTGRSIGRLLSDEEGAVLFYHPECFRILGEWLALVTDRADNGGEEIHLGSMEISRHLHEYLCGVRFPDVWEKLRNTCPDRSKLLTAFHGWFDGLKTMKLIHHLSTEGFPRSQPEEAVPRLFDWAGLEPPADTEGQLALLREMQIGEYFQA
ncbi:MAG TPA: glycosyltransferase family A protein [Geobacteraceae bacterium]|nr:glycosyltransferase family A protein [Geobacteraceae bacterium]